MHSGFTWLAYLPVTGGIISRLLATSFRIKAAARSANRANRERLRSVNDCVERCACQSAHPIYKRRRIMYMCVRAYVCVRLHMVPYVCVCMQTLARDDACTYMRAYGDSYEGYLADRVCPAIGYRRGVTDFTGRRANEKLVGCEVTRGQRLHPPSP